MAPFENSRDAQDWILRRRMEQSGKGAPWCALVRFKVGVKQVTWDAGCVHYGALVATTCGRCGSVKQSGQSCGCFDNGCE
jgi:hypothetical protein